MEEDHVPRSQRPHHATVTMKIDVREMLKTGELSHQVLGDEALDKYGMSVKMMYIVSGPSEADCIKKLKERLERLNG